MGRRRRNSESLFDIAVSSSRPVSATIAVAILGVGLVVFPFFARGNPFLLAMAQGIKPAVLIAAGLFGIVSLIKFIADNVRKPSTAGSGMPSRKLYDFKRPSVHEAPGATIPRDPMLGADPAPAKPLEWSLELIQTIEWKRFEDVCQKFYESKGIRSACTPLGPDGGIDIRLYQDDSGQATAIVQCKAWGDSYVGVRPIRELLGVMVDQNVPKPPLRISSET